MRYLSTRDSGERVSLEEAFLRGIAPDGGLYVPEALPAQDPGEFVGLTRPQRVGSKLLHPFFEGSSLEAALPEICEEALDFPLPLSPLNAGAAVLELFHGPTAAFKDVGARFLASCLSRLHTRADRPLTVIVATSGDTGGAVAAAFHGKPGVEVVVLYPAGMVSPRQEEQLTSWGGNVRAFRVGGDFDACQRLAKAALADPALREHRTLTSANSINLGRLLPQTIYYAAAALEYWLSRRKLPGFIVPTGNTGNALACLWAMEMGMPIREIVLATNANPTVTEFLRSGRWEPSPTVSTLATAMDVGNPSNMERVFHLFGGHAGARERLRAFRVDDEEIRRQIRLGPERWKRIWDPHTATAAAAHEQLGGEDWILVATAHPAKFEGVVEPLIGQTVPVPPALAAILERPASVEDIPPALDALRAALLV